MRVAGWVLGLLAGCAPRVDSVTAVADAGRDRTVLVGEEVTLDAGASVGVDFVWYINGEVVGETRQVTTRFTTPGRLDVVLQVTGEDGLNRSDGASWYAVLPPAPVAPSVSSRLVVVEGRVWVTWPEAGRILGFRGPDEVIDVAPCNHPLTLAVADTGFVVACGEDAQVVKLDPQGGTVQSWDLGQDAHPVGVAWDKTRDGFVAALAGRQGVVRVVGDQTEFWAVPDPRAVAVLPDGSWLVSRFRASPDGGQLFAEPKQAGPPTPIVLVPDEGPDSDTNSAGVPNLLEHMVVSPDGGTVWIPGLQANIYRGSFRSGRDLTFETTVRAILSRISIDDAENKESRKIFDDQGRALAAAVAPRGEWVWVAFPGTGTALAVDAFDGSIRRSILGIGRGVVGLGVSDDHQTLYTWAWLDRSLHAWDLTVDPPVRRWTAGAPGDPLETDVLTGLQLFWEAGDRRVARSGYLACAHCHPDGDHDGLTWDFTGRGEGLRNTTTLWGRAGTAMGPLHWTGNFDEVHDFENDIRAAQGGTGLMDDEDFATTEDPLGTPKIGLSDDLDALAAYLQTLDQTPKLPDPPAPGPGIGELFDARCSACHPAPLYTDSRLDKPVRHDVGTFGAGSGRRRGGTLDGLDTPTLLGTWATGPWLHDGSAPTLSEAIIRHVPGLTLEQAQGLERYVRAL
jgi:hypothetical protein